MTTTRFTMPTPLRSAARAASIAAPAMPSRPTDHRQLLRASFVRVGGHRGIAPPPTPIDERTAPSSSNCTEADIDAPRWSRNGRGLVNAPA